MSNQSFYAEEWFYLIESQTNKQLPDRLELLPGLRARFGNLLREDIVSVALVSDGKSNLIVVSALGESLIHRPINHYISSHLFDRHEPFELRSLLPIAGEWVDALDSFDAASEFELFTPHALALIERISGNSTCLLEQERSLELAKNAMDFQLSLAQDMAAEFAPAIRKKIESEVRAEYQSNPANDMAGDQCQNEWQELGAMLFDGSHLLLEVGIQQLQYAVLRTIRALSYPEQLSLWFYHCENTNECLDGRELGDSFDVLTDTDTFDPLIESISESLQSSMMRDWENKISGMEGDFLGDEEEFEASET